MCVKYQSIYVEQWIFIVYLGQKDKKEIFPFKGRQVWLLQNVTVNNEI